MKTIAVDFDGVLHSYTSGWQGPDVIPDPPTLGALSFVMHLQANGWEVIVVSARAATRDGQQAIIRWLIANEFPDFLQVQCDKPPALVYLDDRALRFEGPDAWPKLAAIEDAATPWNKPAPTETTTSDRRADA